MKKYKISLSFTCNEDWNEMLPVQNGRHCLSCNKVVIDFTRMTDAEILEYLFKQKNTCGRFYKSQLGRTMIVYRPRTRKLWPAIAAMLVAGLVSLAPVQAQPNKTLYPVKARTEQNNPMAETEPGKNNKIDFTIRLFRTDSKEKIYGGVLTIEGLGSFNANEDGLIIIQMENEKIPDKISLSIYAPGFEYKQITMYKKDIQESVSADIYLEERMEMLGGVVEYSPED